MSAWRWLLEVAMNQPEVVLAPVLLVAGLAVVWPRGQGKDRRR